MKLGAAIPVLTAICFVSVANGQHATKPAPKAPTVHPLPPAPPPPPRIEPETGPGSAEHLNKLLKLTPEQRNKALSALPPGRRAVIERRLNDYLKMPEPERNRAIDRLRRMQSLPPQKQNQVRASSKRFLELPQPRHRVVKRQLDELRPLSDADRRALMNSEEFRNKFTASEQQMIEDICLVTPQN
jgi:hypothetical protein